MDSQAEWGLERGECKKPCRPEGGGKASTGSTNDLQSRTILLRNPRYCSKLTIKASFGRGAAGKTTPDNRRPSLAYFSFVKVSEAELMQ
jgi:hypothetical protein